MPSLRSAARSALSAVIGGFVCCLAGAAWAQVPPAPIPAAKQKATPPAVVSEPFRVAQPPSLTPTEIAALVAVDAVKARAARKDYETARWDPIHFKPAIDQASDEACLVCHKEIDNAKPRAVSPAGVKAVDALAWYQTLDTYQGAQADFHWRHRQSPFAKQVMNLTCNFCHQGNDVREESPHVTATAANGTPVTSWNNSQPAFTLRKMVNPSETCLRCHGAYPAEIMGLPGPWHEQRDALETADAPNGCLSCHAEQFRTRRHQVSYLKPKEIETLAQAGTSDTCYGCHGGRQWYRNSYPYPRTPWPDMPAEVPDWATKRPTASDARFRLPEPQQ